MKHKPNPSPPPQNLDSPRLAGGSRGRGSARESGHAVQEEGAVSPSPLAGEGWGEGAASEPLVVSEGPITPYIAKPQQLRHSRESANPVLYRRAPLGDLIRPRREKAQPAACADLAYIGMEHVESHTMRLLGTVPAATMKSMANRFYAGDVLYGRLRPYLNKVYRADFDGLCSAEFIVLPKTEGVDPDFLRYRLNSRDFVSFTTHLNAGDRPRVDFDQISPFEIEVPEPNEQRRIVAELETQLTRLDASVTALKRVQANLKRYRASVLKAACEGRLVPTESELARSEGRAYESGAQLLTRILQIRRERWDGRGKCKEPLAPTNTLTMPEGWAAPAAEQVGSVQLGRQRSPKNRSKDYPTEYIRAANITERGLDLSDVLDMEFSPAELERYRLHRGDLVLSEASGSPDQVGKPAMWRDEIANCCFQNTVIRLRPILVESNYLLVLFKSFYFNGGFARVAGGVGINHLSADRFSSIHVPLPPLAEQHRIVAEVERRLSVIEELETTVVANLKRAGRLRQTVLARAFVPGP